MKEQFKKYENPPEITDDDRAEIGHQVSMGMTSGRLDSGNKCISWGIKIECWEE